MIYEAEMPTLKLQGMSKESVIENSYGVYNRGAKKQRDSCSSACYEYT